MKNALDNFRTLSVRKYVTDKLSENLFKINKIKKLKTFYDKFGKVSDYEKLRFSE